MTINPTPERLPADAIFQILRDRICLLDYPPGTVLRETELAKAFGVSRTPIRAVLQRLAHGGLIESRDGVGTIVTDLTFDEIRDIYRLRLKIAELIGQMSPRPLTEADGDAAENLRQRAEALLETFDITEYWQINHDLHLLISGVIGNAALGQIWDHLYFQAARMWYQHARSEPKNVAASLVAELAEVNRAIAENDAVALGYSQRNYIAYGLARLEAKQG
ncbi:MAG: GntR family transcriptional regulator [Rhodospirillaceae bacterium]|nr:GntR family transcriptional regulator [Rhodospirillaceae bacterium]